MTNNNRFPAVPFVAALLVVASVAVASDVTIPNKFAPNTPARASEVNANFDAVKKAFDAYETKINELQSKLSRLEGQTCAAGRTAVGDKCVENTARPQASWPSASDTCLDQGGALCSLPVLWKLCRTGAVQMVTLEWSSDGFQEYPMQATSAAAFFKNAAAGTCTSEGATELNNALAFRCCFPR